MFRSFSLLSLLVASSLFLTGCIEEESSDSNKEKGLFSLWHLDGTDSPLDLRGGSLGSNNPYSFYASSGSQCNCDLKFIGTQESGNYVLNSCDYQYGSGNGDPGCNALNQTGQYRVSNNTLTIIDADGDTETYH